MLQLKKSAPIFSDFQGTGSFKWLSFQGKIYLGVSLFLIGILFQGYLTAYGAFTLHRENSALKKSNERITQRIQSLRQLSPMLISRCQSGLLGGTNLEVADILDQLKTYINRLKMEPESADKKPLINSYRLLSHRLQEYSELSISKAKYFEVKSLYDKYNFELVKFEKNQVLFYQSHLNAPLVHQIWIWILWLVILIALCFLGGVLFLTAGYSISKPVRLLTKSFLQEPLQIFKIEIPITSKEGLGKAGLLFQDSFSHWEKVFFESIHSIQTFEALCKEFATELRKTELYTIQVQQVAELIVETTKEQEHIIGEANDELEYLNNNKSVSQKIPNQMKAIIEEMRHQFSISENQTQTILQNPVEYQDESNEISDLASNLESASMRINGAIKVLEEVAERSELLAFNTAIQAARAGEKGMGFSVVAKEIGKLVERSKKASTRLSELLYKTQEKNREILDLIHHKALDVTVVYEAVGEICSGIFESAQNNFEEIASLTNIMEDIVILINDLSKESNLISSIPQNDVNHESFAVEILDYQLNVKETNRIAEKISELSEKLRSLTETSKSIEFPHRQ